MIFVDTGAWYASVIASEVDHEAAAEWLSKNSQPLLTTDFIADEILTLLRARGHGGITVSLGAALFDGSLATLYLLSDSDIREGWRVFQRFADKRWSFTDCTSKVVMERLDIKRAFSFDQHFRQFGTVEVVPG